MKDAPAEYLKLLRERYGKVECSLNFTTPLELLVATILSAQCTDIRVNIVTKSLFKKYQRVEDYAQATDLASDIKSINFYNNKAKNIQAMASRLIAFYHGEVPHTMEDLITLPGVARKTANVVLSHGFHIYVGVVVDTHVKRITNRLGLTTQSDPKKVELDLMKTFENRDWADISSLFIALGRDVCQARTPNCEKCILQKICPSSLTY